MAMHLMCLTALVWGAQIDTRCSDELASARAQITRIRERLISLLKGRPGELTERVSPVLQTRQWTVSLACA